MENKITDIVKEIDELEEKQLWADFTKCFSTHWETIRARLLAAESAKEALRKMETSFVEDDDWRIQRDAILTAWESDVNKLA